MGVGEASGSSKPTDSFAQFHKKKSSFSMQKGRSWLKQNPDLSDSSCDTTKKTGSTRASINKELLKAVLSSQPLERRWSYPPTLPRTDKKVAPPQRIQNRLPTVFETRNLVQLQVIDIHGTE